MCSSFHPSSALSFLPPFPLSILRVLNNKKNFPTSLGTPPCGSEERRKGKSSPTHTKSILVLLLCKTEQDTKKIKEGSSPLSPKSHNELFR